VLWMCCGVVVLWCVVVECGGGRRSSCRHYRALAVASVGVFSDRIDLRAGGRNTFIWGLNVSIYMYLYMRSGDGCSDSEIGVLQ